MTAKPWHENFCYDVVVAGDPPGDAYQRYNPRCKKRSSAQSAGSSLLKDPAIRERCQELAIWKAETISLRLGSLVDAQLRYIDEARAVKQYNAVAKMMDTLFKAGDAYSDATTVNVTVRDPRLQDYSTEELAEFVKSRRNAIHSPIEGVADSRR